MYYTKFERLFHKKNIVKLIFLFPLLSCLALSIGIKHFADINATIPFMDEVRKVFIVIVGVLFLNVIASFISLILYYCLANRLADLTRRKRNRYKR